MKKKLIKEYSCASDNQPVSQRDLDELERYLDKVWKDVGIDIDFTRHFLDRVNDSRNGRQITTCELQDLFKKSYEKYADMIAKHKGGNWEAVLNSMKTQINVPFALEWNRRDRVLELIAKTVMRKKNFMTPDKKLTVENVGFGIGQVSPVGGFESIDDVSNDPFNIEDPQVVQNINGFLAQAAKRTFINPYYPLQHAWNKLSMIGLTFPLKGIDLSGDKGVVFLPLTRFGGRFGVGENGEWLNDDGISHKIPGGLSLKVEYESNNGEYTLNMAIVNKDNDCVSMAEDSVPFPHDPTFAADQDSESLFDEYSLTEAAKTDQDWRDLIARHVERHASYGDKIDIANEKMKNMINSLSTLMKEIQARKKAGKDASKLIERHKKTLARIDAMKDTIKDLRDAANKAGARVRATATKMQQWKRDQMKRNRSRSTRPKTR